jgi:hypothetical protein
MVAELKGKNDAMSGKPIRNATASAIILRILSQRIRETALERQIECLSSEHGAPGQLSTSRLCEESMVLCGLALRV